VIAVAEKSNLFNAPETYMHKIAITTNEKGVVDLDFPIYKNIKNLADYKNTIPENLTACILDRPRHQKIIDELKSLNVKLKLISDGDVSGALLVADSKNNVDIFLGIGGGPEGVLAASALDAYNCFFQGKFIFDNNKDKDRAKEMGINDFEKKYELNEIVSGDSIFCATGITSGDLVNGIQIKDNSFVSETLITHKSSGIKKIYKSIHKI
jgi:fructose-1,6-bisphosphatase II / sedoheptulose-1,7-bisphosphatase